ncbi:unnamed protein product [Allacma fusca]|uniref:DUF5641 domain-containing protein n=1 Tax=Allacma fusca TaxID=39272 RepID=A0A8J2JGB3_9HEXA|nr:unnamed protein product [Allacma fusca]
MVGAYRSIAEGSSQKDLAPLTPSMRLQELREVGIPDMDNIDAHALNKRLVYRQKIREDFRRRFRIEYLGILKPDKSRKLVEEDIKPGDSVLVGSDNTKRVNWPMARILEVFPGKDGVIRVAKIKTSNGELVRPIQRLYPFEVFEKDRAQIISFPIETTDEDDGEIPGEKLDATNTVHKTSRAGGRIKAPNRFD